MSDIDAKTGVNGDQKFKYIGANDFHDVQGELLVRPRDERPLCGDESHVARGFATAKQIDER